MQSCGARIYDRAGDLFLLVAGGLSRGDLVFVRESAEDLLSADPVLGEVHLQRPGVRLSRCELAEGAVRPGRVVVAQVFGEHMAQVVLIDDQQPIEELAAQGPDHPFAGSVRSGCLRRAGENPDAFRCEYGVEGIRELACTVPDQELDRCRALVGFQNSAIVVDLGFLRGPLILVEEAAGDKPAFDPPGRGQRQGDRVRAGGVGGALLH